MTTTLTSGPAAASDRATGWRWSHHAEIMAISVAVLLIEISYTRVFSFKLYYYYVYLVIGLAMLGLSAGAVLVAVSARLRRLSTDAVLFWSMAFGAATTIAGYAVICVVRINTLSIWQYGTTGSIKSLVLILVVCLCVFLSFLGPGVAVATLFSRETKAIGGLYFADLAGATLACATVVLAVSDLGAPATIMLAAAVLAGGAFWVAVRLRVVLATAAGVVLAAAVVFTVAPQLLPTQRIDASKPFVTPAHPALYSAWGSVFRVDVAKAPGAPNVLNLYHDGTLGATIYRWNGKQSFLSTYDFPHDSRSIPFSVLGTPPTHEAVIGAAGGHEVLASLFFQAKHVDAVELNPVTVDLIRNQFANFDGHLAQNPAVNYINGDGRSYLARSSQQDDLIWYPAPDSYAATNSALASANVLSESYLYTTNALVANLQHLTSRGIFVAQFGEDDNVHDLRTTRFVATARQALSQLGISDPTDHILVAETQVHFLTAIPLSTIVVSRAPFTPQQVSAFVAAVQRVPGSSILYAPGETVPPNPVNTVVTVSDAQLGSFYSGFPYNVTPTTDNDPYFWHFARFGTVVSHYTTSLNSLDREDSVGERVLLLLLALSLIAAAGFLLLPFIRVRQTWSRMPSKRWSSVFFAGVGLGFIFFEITLMQLLNLFLGFPTYALTVTLAALLLFTGIGALLSPRIARPRSAVPKLLGAVVVLGIFYLFGLTPVTNGLLSLPLAARIAFTFVLLAPLGLCFGMFMPLGLRQVSGDGDTGRAYVAWGWAVNGFASVVGSALATILSMAFGFDVVLILGMAAYAVATAAWMVLSGRVGPRRATSRLSTSPSSPTPAPVPALAGSGPPAPSS
jgi:hypothetical protein